MIDKEIFEFIEKEKIYSFAEFINISIKKHQDWFCALCDNESLGWMVKEFIESLRWESENEYNRADSILRGSCGFFGYKFKDDK